METADDASLVQLPNAELEFSSQTPSVQPVKAPKISEKVLEHFVELPSKLKKCKHCGKDTFKAATSTTSLQ